MAAEVGIDVQAGVLAEGKVDAIRALQEKYGSHVAMVVDGINEAPALKQANVGIAIGTGADVATEAADVTLVSGELTGVVEAMQLSRATFSKIVQNLLWASGYNIVAIPIAVIGLLHPNDWRHCDDSRLFVRDRAILLLMKRSYRLKHG